MVTNMVSATVQKVTNKLRGGTGKVQRNIYTYQLFSHLYMRPLCFLSAIQESYKTISFIVFE